VVVDVSVVVGGAVVVDPHAVTTSTSMAKNFTRRR